MCVCVCVCVCVRTHTHTYTDRYIYSLFTVHLYHPCPHFLLNLNLLEFHISANIDLVFVGNFNIHIDDLSDVNSIHFLKLLNTLNLCQHVSFPTHNSGHVLDLIITNALSNLVTCPFLLDTYISDHKTLCINLSSET